MGEQILGIRAKMNAVQRDIESVKLQRLQTKLETEKRGLDSDKINLQKADVTVKITTEGLKQEQTKLLTSQIKTQQELVNQYSAQQALNTSQISLALQREQDQATLQLKAVKVAELREQVRQQMFLNGNAVTNQLGTK